ncbi:MAG: aldo/keto reductase [Fibrobacterota bacterium]
MGTMTFGNDVSREESKIMFDMCRAKGVNFFDTANTYYRGESELIPKDCLCQCRDEAPDDSIGKKPETTED